MFWLCLSFFSAAAFADLGLSSTPVSYGSSILLHHPATNYKLFSTKISWGFGSRQQIVTAVADPGFDANTFWIIKPNHRAGSVETVRTLVPIDDSRSPDKDDRGAGSAVRCGDSIRLEHAETEKNLHANLQAAAISGGNYEVSGYGRGGTGDIGDDFKVECETGKWLLGQPVVLRHTQSSGILGTSKRSMFNSNNCPRCPIIGHLEVSIHRAKSPPRDFGVWRAAAGLVLERHEDEDDSSHAVHDEL